MSANRRHTRRKFERWPSSHSKSGRRPKGRHQTVENLEKHLVGKAEEFGRWRWIARVQQFMWAWGEWDDEWTVGPVLEICFQTVQFPPHVFYQPTCDFLSLKRRSTLRDLCATWGDAHCAVPDAVGVNSNSWTIPDCHTCRPTHSRVGFRFKVPLGQMRFDLEFFFLFFFSLGKT